MQQQQQQKHDKKIFLLRLHNLIITEKEKNMKCNEEKLCSTTLHKAIEVS
jgi:hypothetical protein